MTSKPNPIQQLVIDEIGPLLEKATALAEQHGVPFFAVAQTPSDKVTEVDLGCVAAHLRGFRHPSVMRFLIDFYAAAKGDPDDRDWPPGTRCLADGFVLMGAMWVTADNELLRRLAVAAGFVISQGFAELPAELLARVRSALNGVVGPGLAGDYYAALEHLQSTSRAGGSPFTVVEVPSRIVMPGQN